MMDNEVRDLFEEITPEAEYTRYGNEMKTSRRDKNNIEYLEVLTPEEK